jgi:hypothetical protein
MTAHNADVRAMAVDAPGLDPGVHGRCNAPRRPQVAAASRRLILFFVKVYPASKSCHWRFWQALRAAGVPIAASWIDAEFNHDKSEPTPDEWTAHWERCCKRFS